MKLEYLDMPDVFEINEIGYEFMEALDKTSLASLFNIKSVQIIVDHHWDFWKMKNYLLFGLPILIKLLSFQWYSHVVLPAIFNGDDSYENHRITCLVIMNLASFFFAVNEVQVMVQDIQKENNVEKFAGWASTILIIYHSAIATSDY